MAGGRVSMVIGLISDTHGLLRPEAIELLRGSDAIVHAGDIGDVAILTALERIAPVTAVRGNVDTAPWHQTLPASATLLLGDGARLHVLHDLKDLAIDPVEAGVQVIVSGHSHKPQLRRDGVLYVNPGSAGPRRFSLPVSVGRLYVESGAISAELLTITPGARPASDCA